MDKQRVAFISLVISMVLMQLTESAPAQSQLNDIDQSYDPDNMNEYFPVDYNAIVGHVKDFFMYLPVMMSSLKETMLGFPKLAEGIRIMAAGTQEQLPSSMDVGDDCKC